MPKAVITGYSKGIGAEFYRHLVNKGWSVKGVDRNDKFETVVQESIGCDLFINNAYGNGIQIDYLNSLYQSVNKMIICGSVAAFNPDPKLPVYSYHKKLLAERARELGRTNLLMLHLSAKGYNNKAALLKIIDLWLEFPHITEVMFDHTGIPNE